MNHTKNKNTNNINFDIYDYSLIDPCPLDNNIIYNPNDSCSSSSYNSHSSSSSSCSPCSSSSSSYNSYSSSSCSSSSSSSCSPCSSSSSSSYSSSSSSSSSCCHSCHTSSCESSSQSSHSNCDSYFQQKECYVSGNKRTFYDNHGKCVPLPCHEEDESTKSSNYTSINLTKYTNQSNKEFIPKNLSMYKNHFLKIVLKGRINSFNSFIVDNQSITKLRTIGQYKILNVEDGYIVFFIKETNKSIDYNYYINHFNNPMEIIFIKNGFIDKIIEEDLDLRKYIQTLLKDEYKTYYANIYVLKNHDIKSMLTNINPVDLLFYSSQAYFLLKK